MEAVKKLYLGTFVHVTIIKIALVLYTGYGVYYSLGYYRQTAPFADPHTSFSSYIKFFITTYSLFIIFCVDFEFINLYTLILF